MPRLKVTIDGEELPDDEARALWERFSAHMDVHQGDFAGFAAKEGHTAAEVAVVGGVPTLQLGKPPAKPAKGKPKGGQPHRGHKKGGHKKKRRRAAKRDDGQGGSAPPRRKKP